MGSTNALLGYKFADQYAEWDIRAGKHDGEMGEFICTILGKEYRYRAIYPNRPFCFIVGFSAMEAPKECCIVEIKHSISDGVVKELETPLWIVQGAMDQNYEPDEK